MKTNVHALQVLIVDHDNTGVEELWRILENTKYPNYCMAPTVIRSQTKEVEWPDEHLLNRRCPITEFDKTFSWPKYVNDLETENAKLRAEAARYKAALEVLKDEDKIIPEYHDEGMGCGLEDRGITDRYDAMHHGWECAIKRMWEQVEGVADEALTNPTNGQRKDDSDEN